MQVAVIGAGPAGLTAGVKVAQRGVGVDVYEAGPHVGGLARSMDLWGQRVDLGPHRFFSTDARVNQFWLDIVGKDYAMVRRRTRIHFQGQFFQYPLQPSDVCRKLALTETTRCIASYAKQMLFAEPTLAKDGSFESWVIRRFGRRLYERFFKSYSEKLWGIPCSELSDDFAAQRIRQLTLGEALRASLPGMRPQSHRTLVDCFAYPTGGTGMVYQRMAERITEHGGNVILNCPVGQISSSKSRLDGLVMSDGSTRHYDHVISTMPLTRLIDGLDSAPEKVRLAANNLNFRNTVLVYLNIEDARLFNDQWLYIHCPDVSIGRVTNYRNWVPNLFGDSKTSVLSVEYWCDSADATWSASDTDLIHRAPADLRSTGLIDRQRVAGGHVVRVPKCYPVYRVGYRQDVDQIAAYLKSIPGLIAIGRYGSFKYNNQDHSILMGLLAAENVVDSRNHDLWNINSDFDEYQERAIITETGLMPQDEPRNPLLPFSVASTETADAAI